MVKTVAENPISALGQCGQNTQICHIAGREKQNALITEKFCKGLFQLSVGLQVATNQMGCATPNAKLGSTIL